MHALQAILYKDVDFLNGYIFAYRIHKGDYTYLCLLSQTHRMLFESGEKLLDDEL